MIKQPQDMRPAELKRLLEAEGAAAEHATPPIEARYVRGKPRAKMLSVRLNPSELTALNERASHEGIPASTLARRLIIGGLAESGPNESTQRESILVRAHGASTELNSPTIRVIEVAMPVADESAAVQAIQKARLRTFA